MFFVNVSRVGFESAGTCSGFGAAIRGIVVSASYGFAPGQACRLHGRRSSSRRRRSSWTASRYVAAAGRVDNLAFAKTILSQSERDCPSSAVRFDLDRSRFQSRASAASAAMLTKAFDPNTKALPGEHRAAAPILLRRGRSRACPHRAWSWRGTPISGGMSHGRPLIIVDNVPPASIRAAAHDIACRASEVHVLAVGTRAIN
jgi:hypothetical protein